MTRKTNLKMIAGAAIGLASTATAGEISLDRAYAAELRADASTRSSLLQSGGGAGHDGNWFYLADASGANRLNIGGLIQFRYQANFRDDNPVTVGEDNENTIGFSLARTQLIFSGNLINENFTFRVDGDFQDPTAAGAGTNGGGFTLQNAWAQYNFEGSGEGFYVKFGQMKVPLLYEEFGVEDWNGLAVERSIVNEFFSAGFTQGIAAGYLADQFGIAVAISDGANAANTAYNAGFSPLGTTAQAIAFPGVPTAAAGDTNGDGIPDYFGLAAGTAEADFSITARFDWKIMGDWAQFDDMTSFRNSNLAARLGAAFHYQHQGDTNPSIEAAAPYATADFIRAGAVGGTAPAVAFTPGGLRTFPTLPGSGPFVDDFISYTVDGSVEGNGWNIYAAFVGQHFDTTQTSGLQGNTAGGVGLPAVAGAGVPVPLQESDWDNFGVMIQGGFFVTEQAELFLRWDGIFADEDDPRIPNPAIGGLTPPANGFSLFGDGTTGTIADNDTDYHFITVGFNYYFVPESHAAKFTGDIVIGLNETYPNATAASFTPNTPSGIGSLTGVPGVINTNPTGTGNLPNSITGVLGDSDSGEVLLRLQMQLRF